MNQNSDKNLSRQISITIKDEIVSRRLVLKSALTLGCGVLLPSVLIGCDSKQGDGQSDGQRGAQSDGASDSSRAAPASTPGNTANKPAAAATPTTGTNSQAAPATPGKVSQASVQYQDQPKGDQKCSGCSLFIEPNACMVVEGDISPEGWSALWAPKVS